MENQLPGLYSILSFSLDNMEKQRHIRRKPQVSAKEFSLKMARGFCTKVEYKHAFNTSEELIVNFKVADLNNDERELFYIASKNVLVEIHNSLPEDDSAMAIVQTEVQDFTQRVMKLLEEKLKPWASTPLAFLHYQILEVECQWTISEKPEALHVYDKDMAQAAARDELYVPYEMRRQIQSTSRINKFN
ncbi:hypothetical protein LguiB_019751 [Lonicera macranthoides]